MDQVSSSIPEDELNCNHTYGIHCLSRDNTPTWVHPTHICEWRREDRQCKDGSDERDCVAVRECVSGMFEIRRIVTERQMCSPPLGSYPMCVDGQDQLNCTDKALW